MNKETLIAMLDKGQNGTEILQILEFISADDDTSVMVPTLEEIQF